MGRLFSAIKCWWNKEEIDLVKKKLDNSTIKYTITEHRSGYWWETGHGDSGGKYYLTLWGCKRAARKHRSKIERNKIEAERMSKFKLEIEL